MPNWCTNQIHVFGSKGEIRDFHASLQKVIAKCKHENTSYYWLADVADFFNIDCKNLPTRGELFSDTIEYDEKNAPETMSFTCSSAWSPNDEFWKALFDSCYSTLSFVFAADEPGMDIFVKHDPEHKVFGEDYYLLEFYLGTDEDGESLDSYDFFNSEEELLDYANDSLDTYFKTIKELMDFVDKEYLEKDDDFYFNIRKYEDI